MNAVMMTEYPSFPRDNFPFRVGHLCALAKKFAVIIFRHETNFLAVLFAVRFETDLLRDGPRPLLGNLADGKHGAGKLVLVERKQKVSLVLAVVAGAAKFVPPISSNTRIMAGGDGLRTEGLGFPQERTKLDLLVADDARIGRAAALVFGRKIIHDLAAESVDLIDDVVRDVERVRDHAGIRHRLRPAAFVFLDGPAILRPAAERQPNDIVAFLLQ